MLLIRGIKNFETIGKIFIAEIKKMITKSYV